MIWYSGNTFSYLSPVNGRPPGVYLLTQFFKAMFGAYWQYPMMVFGVLCVCAAIWFFVRGMERKRALIMAGVLALPLASPDLWWIGPEAYCYALLLVACREAICFYKTGRMTWALLIGLCAGILFRIQMVFILVAFLATLPFSGFWWRRWTFAGAAIVCAVGLTLGLDAAFHRVCHKTWFITAQANKADLSSALFTSDPGDYRLFEGKPYYSKIKAVFLELDKQKLFGKYRGECLGSKNGTVPPGKLASTNRTVLFGAICL